MADPFSSFGAEESGTEVFERNNQSSIAKALAATHSLGQIAMQPAELREKEAAASKAELGNKQMQMFIDAQQKRAGAAASSTSPVDSHIGQLDDLANQFGNMASDAASAGMVTQGAAALRASAVARMDSARIDTAKTTQDINGLKAQKMRAEHIGSLVGPINNLPPEERQAAWDRANQIYTFQTGERSPYAGLPYDESLVRNITDSAIEAGKQADLRMREADNASKERNRKSAEDLREVRRKVEAERAAIARDREDRLAKGGGGKAIGKTPIEDVALVNKLISKDFGEDLVGSEAAASIAGDAQILLRRNTALSRPQALQQAYNEAKARGDFQTEVNRWSKDKTKYNRQEEGIGKTPESALPFPKTAAEAKKGHFYSNAAGQKFQWTGTGMAPVVGNSARPLSSNNTRSIPQSAALDSEHADDEEGDE